MIWRFTLIEPDLTETEIDEPVGWDALSMVLQRDPDWHGISPIFSANNLQFHDDGYFILKDAYHTRGIDGDIKIKIEWQCDDCSGESLVTIPPINIIAGLHGNLRFSSVNYSNAFFRAALVNIPTYIIRWPGGETADTYDWELGRDDSDTGQYNTLEQLKLLVDEAASRGYTMEVSFVLNICTKTMENQIAMLQHAREIGLNVKFVELGNEVNNTGSLGHTVYPTAEDYRDTMAVWMAAIKAEFPGVKCFLVGENKIWEPDWNTKMLVANPDGLIWHEGVTAADYIESGIVDRNVLNAIIQADWIAAGFDLVDLPVHCTEFNYKFDIDDPPLTDQQIYDTALYMLRKISALISTRGSSPLQPRIMCLRGAAGNQPAVDETTFELTPIGLALRQFNLENSTIESVQEEVTDSCMKTFFEGKIDFGRYDEECGDDDCYIIAGIEDTSPQTLLKNRQDTDVDLTSNVAYDGATVLTDYAELGIDIEIPGKKLQFVSHATKSAVSSYDVTADAEFPEPDISDTGLVQGAFVPGLDKTVLNELNDFTPSAIDDFYYPWVADITAVGSVLTIAAAAENIQCGGDIAIEGRYKGTIHYNGNASRDLHVSLDVKEITPDNVINDRFASLVVNQTAEINSDHDYPIDVSFSFTVPNVPVGTKYWFQLFINTLISTTGTRQLVVDTDVDTYFKASIASLCDPTPCKSYLIHEAASRVIESITNNTLKFKSAYFGRTDSQPYSFPEDGCGGLRSITNGLQLRRALLSDGSSPKVFTNWTNILKSLNACDLIGFDVKDSDVRAEPVKFFYDDTVVFVADGVQKYSKKIKTDRIWNQFNFGFEKYETESTNGLDAIHTKRQYRLPIENIDAILERLCKYITDGYAIEVTRRKFATTEDWRYDQDIFMFCLQRAESDFEVEQGNIDSPENMFDPTTVINYRLTPIRNALRWFKWLMQGKRPIDAALTKMLFNSGEGNYVAKGLLQGVDCVMEAAPIAENDPLYENAFADTNEGKPFIVPEEISFIYPLGLNEFKNLKDNIYGLVQYRRETTDPWKFGWITKLEPHHEDGDATFTLVSAVDGIAVPIEPIYIIEEVGPVITTEGGEGLIIE